MRILCIGGTRSIGPRVLRRLTRLGHEVVVFHRGEHIPQGLNVRRVESPLAAMPVRTIPSELRALEPDVVLHTIAMGEEDAAAAVLAFRHLARRIVVLSSGDVYRAYGIFLGREPGSPETGLLTEDSAVRATRHPYRLPHSKPHELAYFYDKVLVEEIMRSEPALPATILRLPKVYGPEDDADLATVYGFRHHPNWRWTHGHVENVAKAVALAVVDERATGRTYNVGESMTPTVAERLRHLPPRPDAPLADDAGKNFFQHLAYDTTRVRRELGFVEDLDETGQMVLQALGIGGILAPPAV